MIEYVQVVGRDTGRDATTPVHLATVEEEREDGTKIITSLCGGVTIIRKPWAMWTWRTEKGLNEALMTKSLKWKFSERPCRSCLRCGREIRAAAAMMEE